MKCRVTHTIASILLTCGLLLTLSISNSEAAPPPRTAVADTGVIRLGPGQTLSVIMAITEGDFHVRFRRMHYQTGGPDMSGVSKSTLVSQDLSDPVTLGDNEAASVRVAAGDVNNDAVRVMVMMRAMRATTLEKARVTAQITNPNGEVVSFFDIFVDIS